MEINRTLALTLKRRNNDCVIMSKRRHFDVITSKWRCLCRNNDFIIAITSKRHHFDVITTSLLRNGAAGKEYHYILVTLYGRPFHWDTLVCTVDINRSMMTQQRRPLGVLVEDTVLCILSRQVTLFHWFCHVFPERCVRAEVSAQDIVVKITWK